MGRSSTKSYPGDNRLVGPASPYQRPCSAPRCRLNASWRWRSCQGSGCSPVKALRELGSDRGSKLEQAASDGNVGVSNQLISVKSIKFMTCIFMDNTEASL